jgi:hypothetical protein
MWALALSIKVGYCYTNTVRLPVCDDAELRKLFELNIGLDVAPIGLHGRGCQVRSLAIKDSRRNANRKLQIRSYLYPE